MFQPPPPPPFLIAFILVLKNLSLNHKAFNKKNINVLKINKELALFRLSSADCIFVKKDKMEYFFFLH
jgi:hypothetical protein